MAEVQIGQVAAMTVDELRAIIREVVEDVVNDAKDEILREIHDLASAFDPDEGLKFKPEIAESLEKALKEPLENRPSKSLDDIVNEMGLDE